jgi:hypothetical protein
MIRFWEFIAIWAAIPNNTQRGKSEPYQSNTPKVGVREKPHILINKGETDGYGDKQ